MKKRWRRWRVVLRKALRRVVYSRSSSQSIAAGASVGVFVGLVALVGAIRLGKPTSTWSRWFYEKKPKKLERSRKRFPEGRERFRNLVGGAPSR